MTTRYVKPGDALNYTNNSGAAIAVNDIVVVGSFIAVAATNIAIGATGSILGDGVFTLPKKAGTAMPEGTKVTWSVADTAVIVGAGVAGDRIIAASAHDRVVASHAADERGDGEGIVDGDVLGF